MKRINRHDLAQRIDEDIRQLETTIRSLEQTLEPRESDCGIGRIANSALESDRPASEEALRIAVQRLAKLHNAKARLDDVDFDLCRSCGKPISADRLLLIPETVVCAACKQKAQFR